LGDATAIPSPLTLDYLGDAIPFQIIWGMPSPASHLHYTTDFGYPKFEFPISKIPVEVLIAKIGTFIIKNSNSGYPE
jgi:hypothetical protein